MNFDLFDLERFQSTWENRVAINISESGVAPLSVRNLLTLARRAASSHQSNAKFLEGLLNSPLGYSQTNGTAPLRQNIARLYAGATENHVEVTNGGSEANFVTVWRLLSPRDEAVIMMPNYLQVWGAARSLGAHVKEWWLRPVSQNHGRPGRATRQCWAPDPDDLKQLITKKTRLIAVCHPNNPTGATLSRNVMDEVVERARWAGAWILADEVYQGAELEGPVTPSFWSAGGGRNAPYEKLIITNSLSKAYGLPGLRIGWIVGQPQAVEDSWAAHDYTTIGPGAMNDALAAVALSAPVRRAILERTRKILNAQWPLLESWSRRHDAFTLLPPRAGAIAMLKYSFKMNSTEFAEQLRRKKSVLIVPGDHFKMDGYLRIGFGGDVAHLKEGLRRLGAFVDQVQGKRK